MFPRSGCALELQPKECVKLEMYFFVYYYKGKSKINIFLTQYWLVFRPFLKQLTENGKNVSANSCSEILTYFLTTASAAITEEAT